jgi:hypothetical protein
LWGDILQDDVSNLNALGQNAGVFRPTLVGRHRFCAIPVLLHRTVRATGFSFHRGDVAGGGTCFIGFCFIITGIPRSATFEWAIGRQPQATKFAGPCQRLHLRHKSKISILCVVVQPQRRYWRFVVAVGSLHDARMDRGAFWERASQKAVSARPILSMNAA